MRRTPACLLAALCASTGLAQSPAPNIGSTGTGSTTTVGAVAERVPPAAQANDPVVRLSITPAPKFEGPVTLRELFRSVRETSGVAVQGLWKGKVAGVGLDPDATVQVDVPVGNCADLLDLALDQIVGDGEPATWQATKYGVEAGPYSALWRASALTVRVYDVSDLLLRVPAFRSTGIPQPSGGGAGGGGGMSGSGAGSGGGAGGGTDADDPEARSRKTARRDDLVGVIRRNVVPQAWDVNGGPCAITPHDSTLIIRAPEFVHRLIESPTVERRRPQPGPEPVGKPKSAP